MVIENVLTVYILNSQFSDNGIGVHNCSLETHQWWHGVDITASNTSEVSYSFINTSFHGNSHMDQLGGGLHISATDIDSASINISCCEFRDISGCNSTAAALSIYIMDFTIKNIFFPDYVDGRIENVNYFPHNAININIVNCEFIRNMGNYRAGLGIMANNTRQSNILIHTNTFIGNEGKHNGAMCINPVSDRGMFNYN